MEQQLTSKNSKKLDNYLVTNPTQSFLFIKKMLSLSVSNIAYLRGLLPEEAFSTRYVQDMAVKVIKQTESNENVNICLGWMRGCFDAIERRYLKKVTVCIRDRTQPRAQFLEAYTFHICYKDDQASLSIQRNEGEPNVLNSASDLKLASKDCLSNLLDIVSQLEVLPDDVVFEMALNYYDERTPTSYEPPGFQPFAGPSPGSTDDFPRITIGKLSTKYHSMKIRLLAETRVLPVLEDPLECIPNEEPTVDDASVEPESRLQSRDDAELAEEPANRVTVIRPRLSKTADPYPNVPSAILTAVVRDRPFSHSQPIALALGQTRAEPAVALDPLDTRVDSQAKTKRVYDIEAVDMDQNSVGGTHLVQKRKSPRVAKSRKKSKK